MTAITINAKNRTIELTKTFATASSKFGTPEYDQLQLARKDYPNYKVVTIARKAPKNDKPTFKGLTYEYMEKYIMTHDDDKKTIMNEYNRFPAYYQQEAGNFSSHHLQIFINRRS